MNESERQTIETRLRRLSEEQRLAAYRLVVEDMPATVSAPVTELIAFYTGSADSDALRPGIAERLPEHARPTRYVHVKELPVTPNGKLDRSVLNALVGGETTTSDTSKSQVAAAVDANASAIVAVFRRLLTNDDLHAESNFFTCGGHSLLAMEAVLSIEEATGCRIPIATFFSEPTPNGIAATLRDAKSPKSGTLHTASEHLYPVSVRAGNRAPVLVVFSASQLAYALVPALQDRCNIFGANVVWLKENGGAYNDASIGEIAERIYSELCKIVGERRLIIAGSSFPGTIAFEVAQLSARTGHTPDLALLFEPTRIAKGSNRLQLELEAHEIESGDGLPVLSFSWLKRNHPLSGRFWRRAWSLVTKVPAQRWQRFQIRRRVERHERLTLEQTKTYEGDRMTSLWRNYRPQRYTSPIVLFTSEEHDAQLRDDWLARMPKNTRFYKIATTHARLLSEPEMSTLVVPTVVQEVRQAIDTS